MSRVIKFRFFDTLKGKTFTTDEMNSYEVWDCMLDDRFIESQFTGLLDINLAEIYEGDLLRVPANDKYEQVTYNCFEVFYHNNECIGGMNIGFCINRMHTQGNSAGGYGLKFTPESIYKNKLVIIGNIHENPELLNKEES